MNYYSEVKKSNRNNRKNNKKRKPNASFKSKIIFWATIALAVCIAILFRYAQISNIQYDMVKYQHQIIDLKNEKQQLKLELEGIMESGYIEKQAKEKLGMQYPTDEQIVVVNISDEELNDTEVAEKETKDAFFLSAFKNSFNKIINLINGM